MTPSPLLAVTNSTTHDINVYDIDESTVKYTFKYHKAPIVGIVYNEAKDYVVSLDKAGVFNYWTPQDGSVPKQHLEYRFQVTTDLITFKKNGVAPLSLSMSRSGARMGVFAADWKVRRTLRVTCSSMCSACRQASCSACSTSRWSCTRSSWRRTSWRWTCSTSTRSSRRSC